MSAEIHSSSGYCSYFTRSPCIQSLNKIIKEKALNTIRFGICGASVGGLIGLMVVIISVPAPTELEDQNAVLFNAATIGAGSGAIFTSAMYCLYSAKILECLIKVFPKKCCQKFNDGHLQAPIIEENL